MKESFISTMYSVLPAVRYKYLVVSHIHINIIIIHSSELGHGYYIDLTDS